MFSSTPSATRWLLKDSKNPEKSSSFRRREANAQDRSHASCDLFLRIRARTGHLQRIYKPNGFDDGDADDIHRYNNWYSASSFVTDAKFEKEAKQNGGTRPLIGQEMSTGYPDLDTGLPVFRYTRDLVTPQAWIGNLAYPRQ